MECYFPAEEAQAFQEDLKHLDGRHNLTYLMDGWEDSQKQSIYGYMLAEVLQFPVVLSLEELTRVCATADHLVEVAIIGKIVAFPSAKQAVSKNTQIITFFNSSHYWGGQLEEVATNKGVTCSLKTNTESCFHTLIL